MPHPSGCGGRGFLGIPGSMLICSAVVLTFDVLKTKAKAMQMRVAKLEGESGEGDADNTEDEGDADNADNAEEENDEDESGEDEKSTVYPKSPQGRFSPCKFALNPFNP